MAANQQVGKYLKHLRTVKEPSWTLKKVSEASGLSVSYLSDIERGVSDPSLESLIILAGVYNMGAGDLLVAAGYTKNPGLAYKSRALVMVICEDGQLTFERLPNSSSDIA